MRRPGGEALRSESFSTGGENTFVLSFPACTTFPGGQPGGLPVAPSGPSPAPATPPRCHPATPWASAAPGRAHSQAPLHEFPVIHGDAWRPTYAPPRLMTTVVPPPQTIPHPCSLLSPRHPQPRRHPQRHTCPDAPITALCCHLREMPSPACTVPHVPRVTSNPTTPQPANPFPFHAGASRHVVQGDTNREIPGHLSGDLR